MARIRTIKPEFPQSEVIGTISREARLLFIQLWTIADDHGRCRSAIRYLCGQLYPYDDDAIDLICDWLQELEAADLIARYTVDGSQYMEIVGWSKHQRVDNAGKSHIPPRTVEAESKFAATRGDSPRTAANRREHFCNTEDPPLDLGPSTIGPSNADLAPSASASGASELISVPANAEADYFRRGKEILGDGAGGLLKKLLDAKGRSVPGARAALEIASEKQDPREYIGGVLKGSQKVHYGGTKPWSPAPDPQRSVAFQLSSPGARVT